MATLTGTRAATNFPVGGWGESSNLKVAWGSYELSANPTQNNVIRFCFVPKNARVLGGYVQAKDLDTGTETFDMDIGWAASGVETLDADGLGNFGVWTGDAVTGFRPEPGIYYPLGGVLFTTGPKKFSAETLIQGTVNAAANATGTGIITVVIFYELGY